MEIKKTRPDTNSAIAKNENKLVSDLKAAIQSQPGGKKDWTELFIRIDRHLEMLESSCRYEDCLFFSNLYMSLLTRHCLEQWNRLESLILELERLLPLCSNKLTVFTTRNNLVTALVYFNKWNLVFAYAKSLARDLEAEVDGMPDVQLLLTIKSRLMNRAASGVELKVDSKQNAVLKEEHRLQVVLLLTTYINFVLGTRNLRQDYSYHLEECIEKLRKGYKLANIVLSDEQFKKRIKNVLRSLTASTSINSSVNTSYKHQLSLSTEKDRQDIINNLCGGKDPLGETPCKSVLDSSKKLHFLKDVGKLRCFDQITRHGDQIISRLNSKVSSQKKQRRQPHNSPANQRNEGQEPVKSNFSIKKPINGSLSREKRNGASTISIKKSAFSKQLNEESNSTAKNDRLPTEEGTNVALHLVRQSSQYTSVDRAPRSRLGESTNSPIKPLPENPRAESILARFKTSTLVNQVIEEPLPGDESGGSIEESRRYLHKAKIESQADIKLHSKDGPALSKVKRHSAYVEGAIRMQIPNQKGMTLDSEPDKTVTSYRGSPSPLPSPDKMPMKMFSTQDDHVTKKSLFMHGAEGNEHPAAPRSQEHLHLNTMAHNTDNVEGRHTTTDQVGNMPARNNQSSIRIQKSVPHVSSVKTVQGILREAVSPEVESSNGTVHRPPPRMALYPSMSGGYLGNNMVGRSGPLEIPAFERSNSKNHNGFVDNIGDITPVSNKAVLGVSGYSGPGFGQDLLLLEYIKLKNKVDNENEADLMKDRESISNIIKDRKRLMELVDALMVRKHVPENSNFKPQRQHLPIPSHNEDNISVAWSMNSRFDEMSPSKAIRTPHPDFSIRDQNMLPRNMYDNMMTVSSSNQHIERPSPLYFDRSTTDLNFNRMNFQGINGTPPNTSHMRHHSQMNINVLNDSVNEGGPLGTRHQPKTSQFGSRNQYHTHLREPLSGTLQKPSSFYALDMANRNNELRNTSNLGPIDNSFIVGDTTISGIERRRSRMGTTDTSMMVGDKTIPNANRILMKSLHSMDLSWEKLRSNSSQVAYSVMVTKTHIIENTGPTYCSAIKALVSATGTLTFELSCYLTHDEADDKKMMHRQKQYVIANNSIVMTEEEMVQKISETNPEWIEMYPLTSLVNENLDYFLIYFLSKYIGLLVDKNRKTIGVGILSHPESVCSFENIWYQNRSYTFHLVHCHEYNFALIGTLPDSPKPSKVRLRLDVTLDKVSFGKNFVCSQGIDDITNTEQFLRHIINVTSADPPEINWVEVHKSFANRKYFSVNVYFKPGLNSYQAFRHIIQDSLNVHERHLANFDLNPRSMEMTIKIYNSMQEYGVFEFLDIRSEEKIQLTAYNRFTPQCSNKLNLAKYFHQNSQFQFIPHVYLSYDHLESTLGTKPTNWDTALSHYIYQILSDRCVVNLNEAENGVSAEATLTLIEFRVESYHRMMPQLKSDLYKSVVTLSFVSVAQTRAVGIKIALFNTDDLQEKCAFIPVFIRNSDHVSDPSGMISLFAEYFKKRGGSAVDRCLGIMTSQNSNSTGRRVKFCLKKPGERDEKQYILFNDWKAIPFDRIFMWDTESYLGKVSSIVAQNALAGRSPSHALRSPPARVNDAK